MSQTPSQIPVQAPQGQVSVQEMDRQQREREVERQKQARAQRVERTPETESFRHFLTSGGSKAYQAKAKSKSFYAEIGFPQFGGRYAPFSIPAGKKVGAIRETPRGLKVIFTPSKWQEPSETFTPEPQLPSQELVRIQYPELKGDEPERFMSENVRAWTQAGFPQYGKVYTFPFGTGVPEGWRTKSVVLSPYGKGNELIWTIEQFATYTLTPEALAQERASKEFYARIGFPQFGGSYAPFDVPSGFKVASVKETFAFPEGGGALESKLAIMLESLEPITSKTQKPSPPSPAQLRREELKDFGQDIANVKANAGASSLSRTILGLQSQVPEAVKKYGIVGLGSPTAGLVMGAYEVAAFERLVNPYAPGLVEGLTGGKQAMIGTLVGEAGLMLIGGKVASWMVEGTYNPLKWKGSRTESWVIKHSDWYAKRATKGMAPEIVSTPSMMIQQPISMAKLKAGEKLGEYSSYFWGETPIPKAAEVWLAKAPSASSGLKTWVAETWIKRITGGTAFALIQEEIGQTVKPGLPFIPEAQLFKASSFLPKIAGASALLGLGLIPKTVGVGTSLVTREAGLVSLPKLSQISRPKIESLSSLKLGSIVGNVPASVTKAFSVVSAGTKLALVQASVQEAKQVQSQAQIQRQIQRLTGQFKTPTLPKATTFSFPSEEPTKKRKKRGRKALMLEMGIGEFYYPEPPTLEQVFGKPSKRRKKK